MYVFKCVFLLPLKYDLDIHFHIQQNHDISVVAQVVAPFVSSNMAFFGGISVENHGKFMGHPL